MKAIAAALLLCLLLGCKKQTIHGQVFIRQRNGESLKLGVVHVLLIRETSVTSFVERTTFDYSRILRESRECSARLEKDLEPMRQKRSELRAKSDEKDEELKTLRNEIDLRVVRFKESWSDLPQSDQFKAQQTILRLKEQEKILDAEARKLFHQLYELRSKTDPLEEQLKHCEQQRQNLNIEKYFENWIPNIFGSAMTDADGRFEINLPDTGPFFLYAQSQREMLSQKEEYRWLVPAAPGQLNLNNANLYDAGELIRDGEVRAAQAK